MKHNTGAQAPDRRLHEILPAMGSKIELRRSSLYRSPARPALSDLIAAHRPSAIGFAMRQLIRVRGREGTVRDDRCFRPPHEATLGFTIQHLLLAPTCTSYAWSAIVQRSSLGHRLAYWPHQSLLQISPFSTANLGGPPRRQQGGSFWLMRSSILADSVSVLDATWRPKSLAIGPACPELLDNFATSQLIARDVSMTSMAPSIGELAICKSSQCPHQALLFWQTPMLSACWGRRCGCILALKVQHRCIDRAPTARQPENHRYKYPKPSSTSNSLPITQTPLTLAHQSIFVNQSSSIIFHQSIVTDLISSITAII